MIEDREFPALTGWRRVSRRGSAASDRLIRLELGNNDVILTRDPLHAAACLEADAREWLALARYFERRAGPGDEVNVASCVRVCDELLERSIDILAAAWQAEEADNAA